MTVITRFLGLTLDVVAGSQDVEFRLKYEIFSLGGPALTPDKRKRQGRSYPALQAVLNCHAPFFLFDGF